MVLLKPKINQTSRREVAYFTFHYLFSPLIGLEKKCEYVSINNRNRGVIKWLKNNTV